VASGSADTRERFWIRIGRREISRRTLFWIAIGIVLLVQFFPLLWALDTSLMTTRETTSIPATLLPHHPTLESYRLVLAGQIGRYYRNSVIVAVVATSVTIVMATLAAYAFARLKFHFKRPVLLFVLGLSLFPPLAQVIPVYQVLQRLHLIGSLLSLILVYTVFGLPLAVLTLIAFFQDVPAELEQAAMIDGTSHFGAFLRVILPVTLPGIFATAVIVFVGDWNEYLFALNYTTTGTYTLPVGIVTISQTEFTTSFGVLSAALILSVVPLVIMILALERRIVSGLTAGAIKG
jgi:multiple sugar transport system permease protein